MHMYKMRHIATDVALSVCLYVCLSVTTISCAKTDEPIEMLFGVWTRVFGGAPCDAAFHRNSLTTCSACRLHTLSSDSFPGAVAADFLEQMSILQTPVSMSDSESELSLSLGIISDGSLSLQTANCLLQ